MANIPSSCKKALRVPINLLICKCAIHSLSDRLPFNGSIEYTKLDDNSNDKSTTADPYTLFLYALNRPELGSDILQHYDIFWLKSV
jgi:hypothetical protein